MDMTQLRYFVKLATLEHLTRAAEELYISQSTLSMSIGRLESVQRKADPPSLQTEMRSRDMPASGAANVRSATSLIISFGRVRR